MFTGLIEGTGTVIWLPSASEGIVIDVGPQFEGTKIGDSVAINGCCLTVTSIKDTHLGFDLLEETLARTNLREIKPGTEVNLERALTASGRFGGHFVTGHIDATGTIRRWEKKGEDYELRIGIEPANGIYLVPKGCIAIDGISLTVAEVTKDEFSVWIIPHTRSVTALRSREVGRLVNLEFDLLAKYTEKILAARVPAT